jgi:ribonucleoside-triphosphate reductase
MIVIKKRDGSLQQFNQNKIINAVLAAFKAVDGELDEYAYTKSGNIANFIQEQVENADHILNVEEIQDYVEKGLMATKRKNVARAYITYRNERTRARGNLTDHTLLEYLSGQSTYWNEENSNKDAKVVTTQRDYIAGIASTDIARRFLLPQDVCEAHDQGIIHQHDMDYMAQNALTNCCLINLDDMLQNGTKINGVRIDPQHRIGTATTVATQIVTAVASSQYGGSTITLAHLAPFVRSSWKEHYNKYLTRGLEDKQSQQFADEDLAREVKDAVQTFNYQINSMSTTNGQAPFLSVVMWVSENPEYEKENAILIEEFLKQRILGMKNEKGVYVTPAFPKLLYVLDENNIKENSKYWYLTKLAAQCTAKRMVPDYISAKKMREYKVNRFGQGDVYGCMGCRSFLTPDRCTENYAKALNYDPTKGKYYGRLTRKLSRLKIA